MTPERWQQVKDVLAEALELPPSGRSACVEQRCGGDDSLRRDVELLLEQETDLPSRFLSETALSEVSASLLQELGPAVGRRFGAYETIEQIGVGGMGEVYRAIRADDQYRKEVALKVVRGGQEWGFTIARFKNERQI